jgi:hypothetical protein
MRPRCLYRKLEIPCAFGAPGRGDSSTISPAKWVISVSLNLWFRRLRSRHCIADATPSIIEMAE